VRRQLPGKAKDNAETQSGLVLSLVLDKARQQMLRIAFASAKQEISAEQARTGARTRSTIIRRTSRIGGIAADRS